MLIVNYFYIYPFPSICPTNHPHKNISMSDKEKIDLKTSVVQANELDSLDVDGNKSGLVEDFYIDPEIERRAVRKLDLNILPILCLFYFLAALDRSNIGNAGSAGLTEALGLTGGMYSTAVSVFFCTYIIWELPGTLLLKKFKPSRLLFVSVAGWALVCIGTTFVKLYWLLILCRLLLGLFESSFFPNLVVYISGIALYKPDELGLRLAILLSCAAASGAVGGLISYGFIQVHTSALEGFRFIFLIEGLITIICSPIIIFWLPDNVTTAKFFKEDEKEVMRMRERQRSDFLAGEKFEWKEVKIAFLDIRTYFSMIIQFCGDTILYGFSTFLPSILKIGLGFGGLKAQYLTIPVYFFSAVILLSTAILSDRISLRSPFIFAANVLGIVGYIIMLACSNNGVKYFATYLIAIPLYIGPTLNLAWTSNNVAPYYRRTTTIGVNQTIGNLSGAIAGQIYRSSPYVLGNSFSLGCLVVSCIIVPLNYLRLKQLNSQKEKILSGEREDHKSERTGDQVLDYKYSY